MKRTGPRPSVNQGWDWSSELPVTCQNGLLKACWNWTDIDLKNHPEPWFKTNKQTQTLETHHRPTKLEPLRQGRGQEIWILKFETTPGGGDWFDGPVWSSLLLKPMCQVFSARLPDLPLFPPFWYPLSLTCPELTQTPGPLALCRVWWMGDGREIRGRKRGREGVHWSHLTPCCAAAGQVHGSLPSPLLGLLRPNRSPLHC